MSGGPIAFLIHIAAFAAGLPLLLAGLWWAARRRMLRRDGLAATVVVTGYDVRPDFDGTSSWHHPVVEFAGTRMALSQGASRPRWPVGTRLDVRYRPGAAQRMVVDTFGDLYAMPLIIASLGAGLIAFGFI